jgi:hypothetical protein
MLCHRYKMPFKSVMNKRLFCEAFDSKFQECFEENYKIERWFDLSYECDEHADKIEKYMLNWVTKFNKTDFPYYAEFEREKNNCTIKFEWVGFRAYATFRI